MNPQEEQQIYTDLAKEVNVTEAEAQEALQIVDNAIVTGMAEGAAFAAQIGLTKGTPPGSETIRHHYLPEVTKLIARVYAMAFASEGTPQGAVATIKQATLSVFMKHMADQLEAELAAQLPVAGAA